MFALRPLKLVSSGNVPGDQNLRVELKRENGAAVFQSRPAASHTGRHNRIQAPQLPLVPSATESPIQTRRIHERFVVADSSPSGHKRIFLGILLPLLESGTCTLREAIIVGSVVARNSIPLLHSSAAMLKIAEMEYTGANSIFLRIFLDKKYALPYRVVDGLVFHFLQSVSRTESFPKSAVSRVYWCCRFERDAREMPVLWHQALLTFAQRYKGDISSEQRDALMALLRKQSHPKVTAEVRRELQHAKCRDVEVESPEAME